MLMGEAVPLPGLPGRAYLQADGVFERVSAFRRGDPFEPVEKDYRERLDQGRGAADPAVLVSLPAVPGFRPL